MALADYRSDMAACQRCSTCKFIPLELVKGQENSNVCPSIARFNFIPMPGRQNGHRYRSGRQGD